MRISDWSSDVCSSDLIERWHTDVSTYVLKDGEGVPFGLFYLDPYARADKRSGAWMDECINRRHTAHGLQQPVAYLTCNFTPPLPGKPALLRSEEHTSELQSLMRISYAVFCSKKNNKTHHTCLHYTPPPLHTT